MPTARLYHNADCSKCRSALALLLERGVDVEVVSYLQQPPSAEQLHTLLRQLGVPASALVRHAEGDALAARLLDSATPENDVLASLAAHPRLLQRPILVVGDRAVIARPPERVLDLI